MTVAIIGSRNTEDFSIENMISRIPQNATELVSGGAEGVDAMAVQAALMLGLPIQVFSPDYKIYGNMAPLVRDRRIVDAADLVLAFWDGHSRGTAYTLKYCIERRRPFRIYLFHSPDFSSPEFS